MLAFEIHLNGKKLCTAGIGEQGVLSTIINWRLGDSQDHRQIEEEIRLQVGGFVSRSEEYVDWLKEGLRRGDELTIRIVEVASADTPLKKRRENPAARLRNQKAYVRGMAKRFGWKIQTK